MTRAEKKAVRLRLLSSVTAEQALVLLAAPYEQPAPVPGDMSSKAFRDLLERGLAELEPTAQRRYRSTAEGERVRNALAVELAAVEQTASYRAGPPSPFSKRAREAVRGRRTRDERAAESAELAEGILDRGRRIDAASDRAMGQTPASAPEGWREVGKLLDGLPASREEP